MTKLSLKPTPITEGKVSLVRLRPEARPRYRWIVQKRGDGRFIARAPKIGVRVSDLDFKRDCDYGPPRLLPLSAIPFSLR